MRAALIATLAAAAVAVHYANGSPAGIGPYVFVATLMAVFAIYIRGLRTHNYWLSLTGLVEAWFIFEYCIYGTAVSVLGRSKSPLAASLGDAYGHAYLVGAVAIAAFAFGAHFASLLQPRPIPETAGPPAGRLIFLLFTMAGVASLAILLLDPESRRQLLYEHVGLSPREGMGRHTALLFMLPTTAAGWWFLASKPKPRAPLVTMACLFLVAAIHLGYGRRLMWAGAMLLIFHLLKIRGIFTLRARHLALGLPLVALIFVGMEATKNLGWYTAAQSIDIGALAGGNQLLEMVDNSVGRFDTTAALIANRQSLPYYHGATFVLAPLQVLPVSAGLPRSLGVREELGELIYGNFGQGLVSQEASLVGELYANFSYAGVALGFLLVGLTAAWLDARCHHSRNPLVALGYGLCLFRVVHQLATASTSWVPLTILAFVPWLIAAGVNAFRRAGATP
jgi:hypothetical protein